MVYATILLKISEYRMMYTYLFLAVVVALAVKITSADLVHGKYTENLSFNWQTNPIWGTDHFSKDVVSCAFLGDDTESSVFSSCILSETFLF